MVKLGSSRMLQFYIQYASIALLYYDYALTFGMELKYMWGERFRLSTILYVWCRYALVANIVYLFTISGKIDISCDAGYKISSALSVLGRTAVIVVWGARTYAVFGKNCIVLGFFATVGLSCIILDIMHIPVLICNGNSTKPLIGGLLAGVMCIFEVSSASLTTFRSIQTLQVGGAWYMQKKAFMYLLLEQGVLYFCFATVLTVASLALNLRVPGGFLQRLLNALTLPISGMMTARFLLHLRRWEAKHSNLGTDSDGYSTRAHVMEFNNSTNQGASQSYIDDFGEDPVRRAEQDRGRFPLGTSGA